MQEMRDRRVQAAQEPGERDGHPQDLAPRLELDRLDSGWNQVRPASDRGQPQAGRVLRGEAREEPAT